MKYFIFFIGFLFLAPYAGAQVTVTDDPDYNTTDTSALLEVKGTSGGFLLPRMTTSQQQSIPDPAAGLVVFNTDSSDVYCFDGSVWKALWDYPTDTITVFTCPDSIEYSGQWYKAVQIGEQCWMAENLNVGTRIDGSQDQTDNSMIEKYCYDDDENNCDIYGGLYQWDEMMQYTTQEGVQGICPDGWHLPSDDEWCTLTTHIDPTVDCDALGWSGTDAGYKMKSTSGWFSNGNGSDAYGFAALPGGDRTYYGNFVSIEKYTYFWSSTENGTNAWRRDLVYSYYDVARDYYIQGYGYSVRCLKD